MKLFWCQTRNIKFDVESSMPILTFSKEKNPSILCFHVTSCMFQNVKSQSPWGFSFLWLLNILNTFPFRGFQFNSNLRFYSREFWNSLFSRHRTSRWATECVTYVWKQITHSMIFSNPNRRGVAKSVYVNICQVKRASGSIFIAEVNSRCFHWFPVAITVSLSVTQLFRFHTHTDKQFSFAVFCIIIIHTEIYKFV